MPEKKSLPMFRTHYVTHKQTHIVISELVLCEFRSTNSITSQAILFVRYLMFAYKPCTLVIDWVSYASLKGFLTTSQGLSFYLSLAHANDVHRCSESLVYNMHGLRDVFLQRN